MILNQIKRLKRVIEEIPLTSRTISERKVQPNEYPHSLYIANYSTAAATCLVVKRWLFDLETEESIYRDPVALDFIFQEV